MDSRLLDVGLSLRCGGGQKDGADWVRGETAESQSGGERAGAGGPRWGWLHEGGHLMQSARSHASRAAPGGSVLEEPCACSINSGSLGIGKDFPVGSPEPWKPPRGAQLAKASKMEGE